MESGILGVIGKPGSGKSYWCAKQILSHAALDRRPVYTNIPIKLKRMRAYIVMRTEGPKPLRRSLSRLIRPTLTKQHFGRFCERLSWISDRIEVLKDEWEGYGDLDEDVEEELEDGFWKQAVIESEDEYGPPIYQGMKANWFPPGSVLFLDEVHKWFPAKNYRDEPKYVVDMTSMHRHLQLKIFVVTQRWMNASLSFRSMATELIRCTNFARVPLLGPLRLHMLGLNLFRVGQCLPEDYDERNDELKIGKKDYTYNFEFPTFNGGVYFQLYKSHVHGGSLEDQAQELREVRSRLVGSNLIDQLEDKQSVKTKSISKWQWFKYAFVLLLGMFIAMTFMRPEKEMVEVPAPASKQQHNNNRQNTNTQPKQAPVYERYELAGVVKDGAYIGTQLVRIGQSVEGYKLAKVDVEHGQTQWTGTNGDSVRWPVGSVGALHASPDGLRPESAQPGTTGAAGSPDGQSANDPAK
ncbi:MAG: zonular occludens toxin domain-containing protein [Phycisphaeraceae bacterium JB051]